MSLPRRWKAAGLAAALSLAGPGILAQNPPSRNHQKSTAKQDETLAHKIRHQILNLPYTSVFDYLAFSLEGNNVTLTGQVLRPTLKASAESAVKSIEGAGSVVNRIEVLPASPSDDELRRTIYRAIYEDPVLARYAVEKLPAIHIIVKNGDVTLEGQVDGPADKSLAAKRASSVAGVSGVANNLVIRAKEGAEK